MGVKYNCASSNKCCHPGEPPPTDFQKSIHLSCPPDKSKGFKCSETQTCPLPYEVNFPSPLVPIVAAMAQGDPHSQCLLLVL